MKQESLLGNENDTKASGPVECLGMTFESDDARRAHFTELLREKLKDPEFRAIEGFPIGTDEAILELSDPPYYTACPNPWLNDCVQSWESQKEKCEEEYFREPFTADVSEGKNDPIYNAHSYHTKVPHKAIMRYILHYTNPGDIVFDGFCGTGMTGVAAQMCGDKEQVMELGYKVDSGGIIYEEDVTSDGSNQWKAFSKLGVRYSVLNDLSPAATLISHNYNYPLSFPKVESLAYQLISEAKNKFDWMYKTYHTDRKLYDVNFVVWSDVFECPNCQSEIVFWESAVDEKEKVVADDIICDCCGAVSNKRKLIKVWESHYDSLLGQSVRVRKEKPVFINYSVGNKRFQKELDAHDLDILDKINNYDLSNCFDTFKVPEGDKTSEPLRYGVTYSHQFYTKRNYIALSYIFERLKSHDSSLWGWFTSALSWVGKEMRLHTGNYFNGGGGVITSLRGAIYIASLSVETNVFNRLLLRIRWQKFRDELHKSSIVSTGSTAVLPIQENSMDYIFIDPPFGANLQYSELNFFFESWLRVFTNSNNEAVENKTRGLTLDLYRNEITKCFTLAYKCLKPGRWLTIEFSNTKSHVWNSLQTSIQKAGFIVANVSSLDKKKGSFNAVNSSTAVKKDLVISAYKPKTDILIEETFQGNSTNISWKFIEQHLKYLPIIKLEDNQLIKIAERDPRILYDQVVTLCIRKGMAVPFSSSDFQKDLNNRFVERDGMFFLPEQVTEYDKRRAQSTQVKQLSIFVDDEASAIEWMRQELKNKPKTYSEIHPLFLNELSGWKKNELELELSTLLEQNFIKYDGTDEVPAQIHTYLSTNFKDMRGLDKSDPKLVAKAKDRWYVPDPNKAADLEKVRLRALLKEFETYKEEKKKIKQPRAEALRAGFNTAWEAQDFQTILDISAKIPPVVLQEDEKLLMFYDNALTLTSTEDDEW